MNSFHRGLKNKMMDRDTRQAIALEIKFVKDDVIELNRSWLDGVRFLAWIVLFGEAVTWLTLFYPQYQEGKRALFELGEIIFISVLFIIANLPQPRPIRIDRKRRIIYFASWGTFYIEPYQPTYWNIGYLPLKIKEHQGSVRGMSYWYYMLIMTLRSEDRKKVKNIRLGTAEIGKFIYRFTNYEISNESVKLMIKSGRKPIINEGWNMFWGSLFAFISKFSFLPALGYNEKRTEKKIQAWLKKYYNE